MFTKLFKQLNKNDAQIAGGKGASLGEMINTGIPVPDGFAVLSTTFDEFIKETDVNVEIDSILHKVDKDKIHTVDDASEQIQNIILNAKIPENIKNEILIEFKKLNSKFVAVRSSATAEDSASAAWAGQLDSFLNTTGGNVIENVKKCWASLFTPRAIFYRYEQNLHKENISVAVVIQKMVNSELSGVAFSVHPVTQDYNQLIIEASYGLGEAIVSGQVTPDSYVVEKEPRRIIDKNVITQTRGLYRKENGGNEWQDLPKNTAKEQVLTDSQILELSKIIINIENHYGFPCDIEWAFENDKFYITQSRPITTLPNAGNNTPKQNKYTKFYQDGKEIKDLYKQEGKVGFYQVILPFLTTTKRMKSYFNNSYEHVWAYSLKGNFTSLLLKEEMSKVSKEFINKSKNGFPEEWQIEWEQIDKDLYGLAHQISKLDVAQLTNSELWSWYQKVFDKDQEMWDISIFIDALDIGADQVEIENISKKYNFSPNEAHILLTPKVQSYITEVENILYKIKKEKFDINNFIEKYFWYGTDYRSFQEVTNKFVKNVSNNAQYNKFEDLEKEQQAILKKYNLSKNPLEVFQVLAQWRDERKRLNYIGLYGCMRLLREGLRRQNINPERANNLLASEIKDVFLGSIDQNILKERDDNGVLLEIDSDGDWSYVEGKEAQEKFNYLSNFLPNTNVQEIKGTVACNGVVKGIVRVVPHFSSESGKEMQKGDILVTSMTRPEFVPLMRKAGAIITNEGGISCHAAIVSRELDIPCIIGTKIATQVLRDGDKVEVDANNGVVKILKKDSNALNINKDLYLKTVRRPYRPLLTSIIFTGSSDIKNYKDFVKESFALKDIIKSDEVWYYSKKDLKEAGDIAFSEWMDSDNFHKLKKTLKNKENNLINSTKLNFQPFCKAYEEYMPALIMVWATESHVTDKITKLLSKKINKSKMEKLLNKLNIPLEDNFYKKEEFDLVNSSNLKDHVREYEWMNSRYGEYIPYTEKEAQERLLTINKSKFLKEWSKNKIETQKAINEAKEVLGKDNEHIVDFMQFIIYYRTQRTDIMNKAGYLYIPKLKELAKSKNISYEELLYCSKEEVLNKLPSKKTIKARMKDHVVILKDGDIRILHSMNSEKIRKILKVDIGDMNEFKGEIACKGFVYGKAKIISNRGDFDKINDGDVLVTSMTTPEMIQIMNKASAFVTNEGGITCHAAIISREMNKPCIIGTKIATQALKDGDEVKVDANNGIVKILTPNNLTNLHKKLDGYQFISEAGRSSYYYPNLAIVSYYADNHDHWNFPNISTCGISKNNIVRWFYVVKNENIFNNYLEKAIKSDTYLKEIESYIAKTKKETVEKLIIEDISKLSNKELSNIVVYYYAQFKNLVRTAGTLRCVDRGLINKFKELLGEEKSNQVINQIALSLRSTFHSQEETQILKLALILKKNSLDIKTQEAQNGIEKIFNQFKWATLGYFHEPTKTKKQYTEEIEVLIKSNPQKILKEKQEKRKLDLKTRDTIIKDWSEDNKKLAHIASESAYLKDYFKSSINEITYKIEPFFIEASKRTEKSVDFLKELNPKETKQLIEDNAINDLKINDRTKQNIIITIDDEIFNLTGDDVKEFEQKYLQQETKQDKKEFKGRCASTGKVKGLGLVNI